jgi:DNA-binding XRE family transcriptional regulator
MKETKGKHAGANKMIQSKFHFQEKPSRLREARVEIRLSQNALAIKLDRSYTTYGDIERGVRPVHQETAERIAHLLKRKVEDLFGPYSHEGKTVRGKWIAKRAA